MKPCSGGDCLLVDLAAGSNKVVLWSSRNPTRTLPVDLDEWIKFVEQAKAGEWDNVLTEVDV
jgi:hypothetical protein